MIGPDQTFRRQGKGGTSPERVSVRWVRDRSDRKVIEHPAYAVSRHARPGPPKRVVRPSPLLPNPPQDQTRPDETSGGEDHERNAMT